MRWNKEDLEDLCERADELSDLSGNDLWESACSVAEDVKSVARALAVAQGEPLGDKYQDEDDEDDDEDDE